MLSAHYYNDFDPNFATQNYIPEHQMSHSGLNTLAEESQYALQQLQQQQGLQTPSGAKPSMKYRRSLGGTSANGVAGVRRESEGATKAPRVGMAKGQTVRRRISRACDQCNQLRTKCDGQHPCAHCVEFGLICEYARERKKRGKASRKDIAAQQAAAAQSEGKESSPQSGNENESDETLNGGQHESQHGFKRRRSSSEFQTPHLLPPRSSSMASRHQSNGNDIEHHNPITMDQQTSGTGLPISSLPNAGLPDRGISVAMSDYGSIDDYHRSILHPGSTVSGHNILHSGASSLPNSMIHGGTITGYGESPYGAPSPNDQHGVQGPSYRIGESPMPAGFFGQSPMAGSPGWFSLPSPSSALYSGFQHAPSNQTLRYPVLRPLLPYISPIIPTALACDLLELYFSSTSSSFVQPQSPYILGYVFRKRSFLRQNHPRPCSPALLASMLWVAAQTSDSAFLTSPPTARGKVCQKLLELTVGLLKPLIHATTDGTPGYGTNSVVNGVALGGFGVALPGQAHEMEGGSPGASGAVDDVATYIHLATVVSASEYKAASLRWWNSAWSLARELKLGRELPPNHEHEHSEELREPQMNTNGEPTNTSSPAGENINSNPPVTIHEEEREERRRIWWLLYIVDRHLALCYNRPLYLLDIECDGLLQPESDVVWQVGEYYPDEQRQESTYYKERGPSFKCTGHSVFGYFLPLMTILGEIVDLNHAKNHPRFGLSFRSADEWDEQAREISQHLETYGRSLKDFETHHITPEAKQASEGNADASHDVVSPSNQSVGTSQSGRRMSESTLQTKIAVAYGTHLMHTLHILLNGKWDPISLLDDNDLWISSQSFISATGHAVSAAEAINDIIDYDPDLTYMPFFFGIYLLQGSFLLLLIADKLQGEASPSVVKACETIVRAHEACVVTLNTEYQVSTSIPCTGRR